MPYQRREDGWIELICGCMFSGKSEELIRRIRRTQIAKQKIQVFSHSLDLRYGIRTIASHSGSKEDAISVRLSKEVLPLVHQDTQVVAVDEVQFFDDGIIAVCEALADRGKRVMAAGLDLDFRGEPFGPMPALLARAEIVDKLSAICMSCSQPATRTQRLVNGRPAFYDDPIIMVGASEVYEARCRRCHEVPGKDADGKL